MNLRTIISVGGSSTTYYNRYHTLVAPVVLITGGGGGAADCRPTPRVLLEIPQSFSRPFHEMPSPSRLIAAALYQPLVGAYILYLYSSYHGVRRFTAWKHVSKGRSSLMVGLLGLVCTAAHTTAMACDAENEPHSRGGQPPQPVPPRGEKPPKKCRWRRRYNLGDGELFYYLGQNNHQRSHSTNIACRNRATSRKTIRGAPPSKPSKTSKYPPTRPMLRRSASHDDINATRRL